MKSKRTKRAKLVIRQSKFVIKLRPWGSFIDDACQIEKILARKPARFRLDLIGSGKIPPDTALLMRSILLGRSARTHITTNARSSLQDAAVLVWLAGDTRLIREDATLRFRPAGPFADADARPVWKDRGFFDDDDDSEEENYIRALHAINEFLPVRELAGRQLERPVLKQFGLVDNAKVDALLATAFGRSKECQDNQRPRKKNQRPKEPAR